MTQPDYDAITVLIPTFNRQGRLQRALESVIEETRIPLQVHIFDNASTDDTARYATAMADADPRIRYFRHPTNVGAQKNYEFAFDGVHKYFVPLADDDWLLPDFLFCAWNVMQQHDDIGATIFVTEQRSEAGELMTTYPTALDKIGWGRKGPKEHLRDLLTYGHYAWSSILWRSEVLSFMKGNYFCGGLASDVDFQVQIFCKYPVFLVKQSGAVLLCHDTQTSREFNVLSVPGWALLVGRMDRSIRNFGVFETEEYLKLRSLMLRRYRPFWRLTENVVLRTDQIIRIAALGGFRLGDWDFAYSILAQVPTETLAAKANRAKIDNFAVLPLPTRDQTTRLETCHHQFRATILFTLLWLKENRAYVESLYDEVDSLRVNLARESSAKRQRTEPMSTELRKNQVRLARSEMAKINLMAQLAERKAKLGELLLPLCRRIGRNLGLSKLGALEWGIDNATKSTAPSRNSTLDPIVRGVAELRAGHTLSFTTGGNGRSALLAGWSQPEREGTWSIGKRCVLKLRIAPTRRPLQIVLRCTPFLHPSHPQLDIVCTIGDRDEDRQFVIDSEIFTPSIAIPFDAVDADGSVTIKLDIRNPMAPAACNVNGDTRLLGIQLRSVDAV